MIGKILVLFFIAAAFGNPPTEVTPERAKQYFQQAINEVVHSARRWTVQLSVNCERPLNSNIQEANTAIYDDMRVAAASYWEAIENLENAAEQKGQDISTCVNAGHEKLYQLNNTIASTLSEGINSYLLLGRKIYDSGIDATEGPFLELNVLKELVYQCDNTVCATHLFGKCEEFLLRVLPVYRDLEERFCNYAVQYVVDLVAQYKVDKESYQAQSNAILSDVQSCVNNL